MRGWIGVDLDGTLAYYDKWRGDNHIGDPIPIMVQRVKRWISSGKDVRIFTARVSHSNPDREFARKVIRGWCTLNIGKELLITAEKDFAMIELWDDRCVPVEKNTGQISTVYFKEVQDAIDKEG